MTTIFAKIIKGEAPCAKVFENEFLIAFKDIHPVAPIHILIVPKKAYRCLQDVPSEDMHIIAEVAKAAQHLAEEFEIEDGYRLLTNNGSDGGQVIFHLHFHLLGGRQMGALG